MLVCFVSPAQRRKQIAAEIIEAAGAAADMVSDAGFGKLVDEAAAAIDTYFAFLGEFLIEAANATDAYDAGLAYAALVDEPAAATDSSSVYAPAIISAAIVEAGSADSAQDAATAAAVKSTMLPGVFVNGTSREAYLPGVMVNL